MILMLNNNHSLTYSNNILLFLTVEMIYLKPIQISIANILMFYVNYMLI